MRYLISDRLGKFEPISLGEGFMEIFRAESKNGGQATKDILDVLAKKYDSLDGKAHEVFADCWAHAADEDLGLESTNSYARMIKAGFPKSLEWVKAYR
jgi:hypothetical protein